VLHYNQGDLLGDAAAIPTGVTAGVKALQEQLRRFAFERGKLECDPARYDGTMTLSTIIAIAHTGKFVGTQIHPVVGAAVDVVGLIKKPISVIPYGEEVINVVLSPWIIDTVYSALLGIIRLIPGGGGVASSIDNAMKAVKSALSVAAAPIATLLAVIPPPAPSSGLGSAEAVLASDWRPPRFYDPKIDGPLYGLGGNGEIGLGGCATNAAPEVGTCSADGNFIWAASPGVPGHWERLRSGQWCKKVDRTIKYPLMTAQLTTCPSPAGCQPVLPPPSPGIMAREAVRDHREWPKGKEIVSADWGASRSYSGKAPRANLAARDLAEWEKHKNEGDSLDLSVRRGAIAFLVFKGNDGSRMGAFWNDQTELLVIKRVPDPDESRYPWDYVADAVAAAARTVIDAASDAWNWIEDNIGEIYSTIKEFGCALINNDVVVAIAAAGTGLVATPATSAAVVSAAAQGRAACAALDVAELVYAILKFLAMDFPKPAPLSPGAGSSTPVTGIPNHLLQLRASILANISANMITMATAANDVTGCPGKTPVGGQVLLPLTPPVVPLATTPIYPRGSIAAFDPKIQRFRIAKRVHTRLGAFEQSAPFEVVQQTAATLPSSTSLVALTEFQKATGTLPITKQPLFWVVVGTSVIAAGAGGYVLYRRRRRLTR
jgi:hypothetical protein